MLQASAQAVDFKVGRYFGEGQAGVPLALAKDQSWLSS